MVRMNCPRCAPAGTGKSVDVPVDACQVILPGTDEPMVVSRCPWCAHVLRETLGSSAGEVLDVLFEAGATLAAPIFEFDVVAFATALDDPTALGTAFELELGMRHPA